MQEQKIDLISAAPGQRVQLTAWLFGTPGHGPKAAIQAALHADEIPAMLVAQRLRHHFQALEQAGQLLGEVVLVPYANPLGLGQQVLGHAIGRFDLRDGTNFNRHYAELGSAAAVLLEGRLGDDAAANRQAIREALRAALRDSAAQPTSQFPAVDLKHKLLQLAIDADIVLDLHCDAQAAMHVYTLTPFAEHGMELGALLGAQAVLLADESGDSPFDEACSRPWAQLRDKFAAHALPLGCFSATVELRGEADTSHALAEQDALAIVEFLRRRGVVAGTPAALPAALCKATPLAGSEPVTADRAGIVVFHHEPGSRVSAGAVVADIVDADSGAVHSLRAQSSGVLYARVATRWATAGKRLAKIAGATPVRSGKLLSP